MLHNTRIKYITCHSILILLMTSSGCITSRTHRWASNKEDPGVIIKAYHQNTPDIQYIFITTESEIDGQKITRHGLITMPGYVLADHGDIGVLLSEKTRHKTYANFDISIPIVQSRPHQASAPDNRGYILQDPVDNHRLTINLPGSKQVYQFAIYSSEPIYHRQLVVPLAFAADIAVIAAAIPVAVGLAIIAGNG